MSSAHFLRQLFLCSGPWALHFMQGLCIGFPTVLVPQLRRANQTISIEQSSWLPSLYILSGIPWTIVLSVLIIVIGRKKSYIIVCINTLIGFIIFYFSTKINHFYIAAIFHGALASSCLTTNVAMLTECMSSEYRGIFLNMKSATLFWGILVANAIGTFFHWQNIVIVGLLCTVYTLLNVIIWPESPLWLATKGRFVECSAAHRWLKGCDEKSEKELEKLLMSHENRSIVEQQWSVRYLFKTICHRQFLKPILLSNLLVCINCFSGKLISAVYAIDILKKISNSEHSAYSGMLIIDSVTVASMYLGCILSKFLRRRTMLFVFCIIAITIMICISIYLYLGKLSVVEENKYISLALLVTYSISVSCGSVILSTTIMGELLPIKSRIFSLCIIALTFEVSNGTFIKMSPFCFNNFGIHGTFALFAILSTIFLVLIFLHIPETKDKTIQEIDDYLLEGGEKSGVAESHKLMNSNSK